MKKLKFTNGSTITLEGEEKRFQVDFQVNGSGPVNIEVEPHRTTRMEKLTQDKKRHSIKK